MFSIRWRKSKALPGTTPGMLSAELGRAGEEMARIFIKRQGYRITAMNYVAPLGRSRTDRVMTGEIDIIAYDGDGILCFIEVKTRSTLAAPPETAVDRRKQRQIIKTSRIYRRVLQLGTDRYRYDVVSIVALPGLKPQIQLIKGYFSDQNFTNSGWWKKY